MNTNFVALDWGTSKLQAFKLAANGKVLDSKRFQAGIGNINREKMIDVVRDIAGDWQVNELYASGMVGAKIGWQFVPYVECPANVKGVAEALVTTDIAGVKCHLVPGLKCQSLYNCPDIMRGEELEIFGWLQNQQCKQNNYLVCLPGTHTKWAITEAKQIKQFSTAMTSELFDCLANNSVLQELLTATPIADKYFLHGISEATQTGQGLTRLLFNVRAQQVTGLLKLDAVASYCRGLLIGHELADIFTSHKSYLDTDIPVIGGAQLSELYVSALGFLGYSAHYVDSQEALRHGYTALKFYHGEYNG